MWYYYKYGNCKWKLWFQTLQSKQSNWSVAQQVWMKKIKETCHYKKNSFDIQFVKETKDNSDRSCMVIFTVKRKKCWSWHTVLLCQGLPVQVYVWKQKNNNMTDHTTDITKDKNCVSSLRERMQYKVLMWDVQLCTVLCTSTKPRK